MTARPILTVEGLAKHFALHHLGQQLTAFRDLSFRLAEGEFLLLTGPNGVGKSSLLRTIWRSYLPTAGHVWLHRPEGPVDLARAADVDIAALRQSDMGFVTQFLTARPRVTAEEVVAEPLRRAGHADPAGTARRHLAEFGLRPALWPAYPATFSGGEQQKVNLARALALPVRLLLLDEPTASLDAAARMALVARLAALKASGVAMIGVFHHPGDVARLIDRELSLSPLTEPADVAV